MAALVLFCGCGNVEKEDADADADTDTDMDTGLLSGKPVRFRTAPSC